MISADTVFRLLIRDLRDDGSRLSEKLCANLKEELKKRRTILSTTLAFLEDPTYDYELEHEIGQREPSREEMLELLAELIDAKDSPAEAFNGDSQNQVFSHVGIS